MKSYADKTLNNKKVEENSVLSQQHRESSPLSFFDNRATAIAQRKLIEAINGGSKPSIQMRTGEEEPLQGKFDAAQRVEDEELLQGKFETVQRAEDEELLQGKLVTVSRQRKPKEKSNNTGLPDNLKSGIETLSGISMDDVKVHYNSDKPGQLQAHAYAQGADIHLASGQEKHLPHEVWHVVQQKQGRVEPTMQLQDKININDNAGLENEADMMGAKALQMKMETDRM